MYPISVKKHQSSSWSWCNWTLLMLCLFQFAVIVFLLGKINDLASPSLRTILEVDENPSPMEAGTKSEVVSVDSNEMVDQIEGVAATLMLHSPTWFQRRYTMMIQNVLDNVPSSWKIQIFYTATGQSKAGIDINQGLVKLISLGKVFLTTIPYDIQQSKKKRYEMMLEPWLWRSMMSERVLIFGGNSVICSNSKWKFQDFYSFDYVGSPWLFKKGVGGDGGISLRNSTLMLAAIDYELSKIDDPAKKAVAFKTWGQEDQFFVSRLLEMKQKGLANPRLATKDDCARFSAIGGTYNNDVLTVSGTLPDIPFANRSSFLNVCPEIKMFYPSLHDPSCFGASPDGEKCALTICALKPKGERRGGC